MRRFVMRYSAFTGLLLILLTLASCTSLSPGGNPDAISEKQGLADRALWPHRQSDLAPDPALKFGRLPNGIRYVLMHNTTPRNRVSMHLAIQAGSMQETDAQRGLAHFLEHMMFNGSEHFRPGELIRYFQEIGMEFGPDANAHTGFYETVYDILLPEGDKAGLEKGLVVLQDYAQSALLLPEEIDRERKVILAEKRTRDSASYRTFVRSLKFELPEARVSERLPIGTQAVIENADQTILKDFYDTWYRPDRMVLVLVGDFDTALAESLISARFTSLSPRAPERPEPDVGQIRHKGSRAFYHHEKEAGNTEITIQVLTKEEPQPDSLALQQEYLIRDMADLILQTRLDALTRKSDTPFTNASVGSGVFLKHVRYAALSAESSPENWKQSLETLEQTLRQALNYGFTPSELERVRKEYAAGLDRAVKNAATRESGMLARRIIRSVNGNRVFQSPAQEKALYGEFIAGVSADDVNRAFRKAWSPDHRLLMVTGNAGIDTPEASIISAFESSTHVAVSEPAREKNAVFPYLPEPETPGRVAMRNEITDQGIIQVDFENGVRLNLKKTDFKANEVIATLRFGEGRAGEPEDRPGLAELSQAVVNESGLGQLDSDQMERALAGKNTAVEFSVAHGHFAFDGAGVPAELPLLFQLLYAHLTDPGFREEAFTLTSERYRQGYIEMARSIEGAMPLSGQRFLAGGDSRFGLPPYDRFRRLTLPDVREWVGTALKNASPELSLVGDFDVDEAVELAARYLGSLPVRKVSADRSRSGLPVFPAGESLDIKVKTRINKGVVRVAYPTDDMWDIGRTRRLATLAGIFSDRLREVIREKLGATYSPYAYNMPSRTYPGYGVFQAVISVAPDNAETVVRAVREIIADMAAHGVTSDELRRALDPTLNSIRDMQRRNSYWLSTVLSGSKAHPRQIEWSRTIMADYAGITVEEISALAKQYLDNTRAAVIFIRPDRQIVENALKEKKS
ncbi:insulinase family protein [Desulfonema ishimotonii]|uniref:Insulinase family protein n=1 Tax=Desulfonema ishimotonii TaxID=45657 RepID=A0A401G1P0_9BACT|nr:M16 family metallopeptidase [Desulfonema ishimotonii]GBC63125.1 insulinase family protein [Desulfonema ishimotonii]